jgi:hypothetical protein
LLTQLNCDFYPFDSLVYLFTCRANLRLRHTTCSCSCAPKVKYLPRGSCLPYLHLGVQRLLRLSTSSILHSAYHHLTSRILGHARSILESSPLPRATATNLKFESQQVTLRVVCEQSTGLQRVTQINLDIYDSPTRAIRFPFSYTTNGAAQQDEFFRSRLELQERARQ